MLTGDPYRTPRAPSDARRDERGPIDRDVLWVLVILWVASAVRVGGAIAKHEPMATETTLALIMMVALPWLARESIAELWKRPT